MCPLSCRRSQELGEYGDAIMTCMQCFQGVDTLRQLTVREACEGVYLRKEGGWRGFQGGDTLRQLTVGRARGGHCGAYGADDEGGARVLR